MESYIYDAVRTVRGKGNNKGALLGITPTELVKQTMVHLKEKHNIDTTLVEDIILGCVTQVMDQAANIAKSSAQAAEYGDHLCGVTLNRFCGAGLESINQASAYIKSGYKDLIIAGGVGSFEPRKISLREAEKYEGKSIFYSVSDKNKFKGKKYRFLEVVTQL